MECDETADNDIRMTVVCRKVFGINTHSYRFSLILRNGKQSPAVGTLTWSVCHAEGWQPIENLIIQEV